MQDKALRKRNLSGVIVVVGRFPSEGHTPLFGSGLFSFPSPDPTLLGETAWLATSKRKNFLYHSAPGR